MLNPNFRNKVVNMSSDELYTLIGKMAYIIEDELEDVAHYGNDGKILPKSEQPYPFITQMMEILEYE